MTKVGMQLWNRKRCRASLREQDGVPHDDRHEDTEATRFEYKTKSMIE